LLLLLNNEEVGTEFVVPEDEEGAGGGGAPVLDWEEEGFVAGAVEGRFTLGGRAAFVIGRLFCCIFSFLSLNFFFVFDKKKKKQKTLKYFGFVFVLKIENRKFKTNNSVFSI
jgi:hypothetical protein